MAFKRKMPKTPPLRPPGRPKQQVDPDKAVLAPARLRPITAMTSGAMASATGAGTSSNSCSTACLASASPPK